MTNFQGFLYNPGTGKQLIRYAAVGIISNVTGYIVYLLATHLGMAPKFAMSVLYGVGAAIGFFVNRSLSFSYKGGMIGSGIRYLTVHSVGYVMNLTMMVVFVDNFGYPHQIIQAIAILVVAAFLFIAFKIFVFRPPMPDQLATKCETVPYL
ncbi:MAG TPA: GtrA family protein [Nitrospira sp.]|nr:GtrA family protein [Nitrospira sp.]